MTAIIRVYESGAWRDFAKSDFPVALHLSEQETVAFGGTEQANSVGWLGLDRAHVFLQPKSTGSQIKLNHADLSVSSWLSAGDIISFGDVSYAVFDDEGVLAMSPSPSRSEPVLTPPMKPPQSAERGEESSGDSNWTDESHSHFAEVPSRSVIDDSDQDAALLSDPPSANGLQSEPLPADSMVDDDVLAPFAPLPDATESSRTRKVVVGLFVILMLGAIFVVIAAPIQVTIQPAPDTVSIRGLLPSVKIGDRRLALPGQYDVVAKKEGFRTLEESIQVGLGQGKEFRFELTKLPGILNIESEPVAGAQVLIDDEPVGQTPLLLFELDSGNHEIRLDADRYLPVNQSIEIDGMGISQNLKIELKPGWGVLQVTSTPPAARVWMNGAYVGDTPFESTPMAGDYRIEVHKRGWKSTAADATVVAGETIMIGEISLEPADGVVNLTSTPSNAKVTLNGRERGQTPITLSVAADNDHQLIVSLPGHESVRRSVRVEPGEPSNVNVVLQPEYGTVFITSAPADAVLRIDGVLQGSGSRRLRLPTRSHLVEIERENFQTYTATITPTAAESTRLDVTLQSKRDVSRESTPEELRTAGGQLLRRVWLSEPFRFSMGASRREPGRRANESQYEVELTRSFFVSEKEVTNAEFRQFVDNHDSGNEFGINLNENNQPVVSVDWDSAARYLNWLSQQDSLPPAYYESSGEMHAVTPLPTGYRLPTEAEWAFLARFEAGQRPTEDSLKFAWTGGFPPPANSGNFAGRSADGKAPAVIRDYDDGYALTAPVGRFPPNRAGLYDLAGNVAEWCHDYYTVRPSDTETQLRDPSGPEVGRYHVIRGSSWRHGRITEIRLSYRDYAVEGRTDVGFRIARYIDDPDQ